MIGGENAETVLKIAYFGFDPLMDCLKLLNERCDVRYVFTFPGDEYDSSVKIRAFAAQQGIPCFTEKVTPSRMRMMEEEGIDYLVVGGYIRKIPVSGKIRQVNIHPAYLPEGRGAWPMPVALLKEADSGVTLHKLTEGFDEGDILLQERIPFDPEDDLETLTDKIRETALGLMEQFLKDPAHYWEAAVPQEVLIRERRCKMPLYWEEPSQEDMTILPEDTAERIDRKLKAFRGFGVRYRYQGLDLIVQEGYTDQNGMLVPVRFRPAFRDVRLEDRDACEELRARCHALLSDYNFTDVYCWRRMLNLKIYRDEDLMVISGSGYIMFPLGTEEKIREFIGGMLRLGQQLHFRYCDEDQKNWLDMHYPGMFSFSCPESDRDYVIGIRDLLTLPGGKRIRRRNDVHHFEQLEPPPVWERITRENLFHAARLSELADGPDRDAEKEALRHFFELGLKGTLVKQGDRYISYSIISDQDGKTIQGHFLKCISEERGGYLFTIQSSVREFAPEDGFMNLEDDLGHEGLRSFKMSLDPDIIKAYEIRSLCPEDQEA